MKNNLINFDEIMIENPAYEYGIYPGNSIFYLFFNI